MSIYRNVRDKATEMGIELTDGSVNRIVGTARFASLANTADLIDLIRQEHEREVQKTAGTAMLADTFAAIDSSLRQGACPRCGKKMKDVKLADYTPAKYCDSDCRITLWEQTDEAK